MANKTTVIATAVTTGNTPWVQVIGDGNVVITTGGTYNGATVAMEARLMSQPSTTAGAISAVGELFTTAPSSFLVHLTPQHEIRFTTTGGGGSQSINFYQSQYSI